MKLTLSTKSYGYSGYELADLLSKDGIVCEFCDPDFLVLMPTPEISDEQLTRLENALNKIPKRSPITTAPPAMCEAYPSMTPREAIFRPSETVSVENAKGRILSDITVGCPPAVPIVVSGEVIDENAQKVFEYYGITHCSVVK